MRLDSIKLSGFKSFAEPTNFMLPGQLVGVVGPNGCGKSNIMDAVRWVLGESRASELRGESMQDVIFNGTTTRKPASRASVELAFDNAAHRAGGPWNQFAEISVKRVLTRDGASSYYINNQPVRRRDVQDVFLGTGLGPRAYAIIGQGTISRIIESRPEELRLFLEEAAGVSKYKERRRETENRLTDTRENLTRVEDILRELTANLDKLEQQAAVAQQYQGLQADARLKQNQLWYLKRAEGLDGQDRIRAEAAQAAADLDARAAQLRGTEADLETIRQSHYAAGDAVNQAQGLLYEASAEVGKLEAEIRYVVEGRQRAQARLVQLDEQAAQWGARRAEAAGEIETLAGQAEQAEQAAAALTAQLDERQQALPDMQDALRAAQAAAAQQRDLAAQVQQQIQVLAAEQRGIEEQLRQIETRSERLAVDQSALAAPDGQQLAQQQAQLVAVQAAAEQVDARLEDLQAATPRLDEERQARGAAVNAEAARLTDLTARLEALRALQDKVKTDGKLQPWLARHGLEHLPGLWTRLHVEPGWEDALEAALRERLAALEVGRLETVRAFAASASGQSSAPPARLAFYSPPSAPMTVPVADAISLPPLAQRLRVHDAALQALLADWMSGCYSAFSLDEALSKREQLGAGETIYVSAGHAVSRHGVSFYAPDNEQAGLLARAQEIENLDKQARAQALIAEEARNAQVKAEAAYSDVSGQLAAVRREAAETRERAHALQVQTLRLTQQAEQTRARGEQIQSDLAELDARAQDLQERRMQGEGRFEELDLHLADAQEHQARGDERVTDAERRLTEAREQLRGL
ncbi:MAG: chromosome segregation protein SMC, partial [Burkholderiaceae bacterium]|nr:chromosome segregation protein SMC [Burkholderiaceae bacterium]